MRVVIVGAGKVATQMALQLHKHGVEIIQIFNRTKSSGDKLAKRVKSKSASRITGLETNADLYLIAVNDDAISLVLEKLKKKLPTTSIVAHTSGTVGIEVFPSHFRNGAVIWPLQSFTNGTKVDWSMVPFVLEAKTKKALRPVEEIAQLLSGRLYYYTSEQKKKLHLAAVFANNFTNHMLNIAHQICEENSLDFAVLKPLVLNTFAKLERMTPAESQTGPAIREDEQTMKKHLELLHPDNVRMEIYRLLSEHIKDPR